MKRDLAAGFAVLLSVAFFGAFPVFAQDIDEDEINPASLRRFWLGETGPLPAAAPYELTAKDRKTLGGTFGIDLSHWSFDISTKGECGKPAGYESPNCSCTVNWQTVSDNGVQFVYSKATDASGTDLSFARFWRDLLPLHKSGKLFRGAYHFLRPGVKAKDQADTFLRAIGAVNGQTPPPQLPPVLDIEWSNREITPARPELKTCPRNRRTRNDHGREFCDVWSTMAPAEIASLAQEWIDLVEKATGRPVIIYTNPTGWWNAVMTAKEDGLLAKRAVWTSRYTTAGPRYEKKWSGEKYDSGHQKWQMAPLPRGALYPQDAYSRPHFWQFTDAGRLPSNIHTCRGRSERKNLDLNWLPISASDFPTLFGVGPN